MDPIATPQLDQAVVMKQLFLYSPLLGIGLALLAARPALPVEPPVPRPDTQAGERFFETKIRPLLAAKCFGCHGSQKQSSGLRLDARAALLQGGESGPVIVPGHPEKSLLVEITHPVNGRMPPTGKLKPEEAAALAQWVKLGAPWGVEQAPAAKGAPQSDFRNPRSATAKSWWAFQPLRKPAVPVVADGGWSRNPIDRFVYQRLKAEGLSPSPEADPATLIRRLYLDLTGLPPTPEEVEAYVRECALEAPRVSPQPEHLNTRTPERRATGAYDRLVDRLLASPRYGERWARKWLDLVRYADSDGYRIDDYRPHAWRYRDYVIRAFNEDKPYDRFVQEQLAGDELFPGQPDALIATGYLRHWIYEYNARDVRGQWTTIQNDLTDTTGDVFLGMGVQCARCHDHKFDPILQKDYYRLQAFFAPILPRQDLIAATDAEKRDHQSRMAAWEQKTADLRAQIEEIEARYRPKAAREAIEKFPLDIQAMIEKPVPARTPFEHQLAELAYRQVDYEYGRLDQKFKPEDKEKALTLRKQLAAFDKEKPEPLPLAFAATDAGPAAPPVLIPKKGKDPVEPGFLTVLDEAPARISGLPNSTGRRAALARWLTRPDNPLTARVMANRVWGWHFGTGLAANASDFGKLGEKPTHPELLDYLAATFAGGSEELGKRENAAPISPSPHFPISPARPWSLKALHRLIVTSATYRQQAAPQTPNRLAQVKDPENRLYWRGGTHRLDAEQIRDSLLTVTGELDLKAGGPGVINTEPRRTIYTRVMRNNRDPLLDVFDLPQFFSSASSRDTTTTPVQSLLLFNSQLLLLRAKALALRLEREASGGDAPTIERAFRLTYGRAPRPDETAAAQRFLEEQARRIVPEEAGSDAAAFLYDKIPFRDGQAAVLSPTGPQSRLEVPHQDMLPTGDFTIEAFILPRSVYETGAVRTIVSKWDGSTKSPGWGFGITGKQSRRKPQTLVLQLIGKKLDGSAGEEAIFSDQSLQINKPYYVSASVKLAADGKPGAVTFRVKDLSNDDEPLLTARVAHVITGGYANRQPLVLGGRPVGDAFFDGLLDDVRLSNGALDVDRLLFTAEAVSSQTVGYWQFEAKPDVFRDSAGHRLDIRAASRKKDALDPRRAALVDFCHVLLNSSEFLYVD
ncbi:MAG: Planctomycete cytochrome [Armatimonadetes bacterium]|nr:Planctomycete cytochrome [Armatimonadota bacterium]